MKISRAYILGVGSGLILSALITLIVPAIQEEQTKASELPAVTSQAPTSQSSVQSPSTMPQTGASSGNQVNDPGQNVPIKQNDEATTTTNTSGNNVSDKPKVDQSPDANKQDNSYPDSNPASISPNASSNQKEETFVISSGMSAEKIAGELQTQGFLEDKVKFLDLVKQEKAASKFRAGTFTLSKDMEETVLLNALIKH